jgi:lipooligosaccharide transport system permease protein
MASVAVPTSAAARTRAITGWHVRSYRRTWFATITTAFLNPIFFLLSVGVLLGTLVDDGQAGLRGLSYVEFVAPGLLAATAMQMGTQDGMYPVMAGIRWMKTYVGVVATPVRVAELVLGTMAWTVIRISVAAVIFTLVAAIGGAIESPLGLIAPLAALLCGLAFHAPMSAISANQEDDNWVPPVNRFVIIPMFLFSGTFFPVSQLPGWLEPVAWVTPLWHGVELCRDLTSGGVSLGPTAVHVTYLAVFFLAGTAATILTHRRTLLK